MLVEWVPNLFTCIYEIAYTVNQTLYLYNQTITVTESMMDTPLSDLILPIPFADKFSEAWETLYVLVWTAV